VFIYDGSGVGGTIVGGFDAFCTDPPVVANGEPGSLISTVSELRVFLTALFDGQLLSDESLAAMTDTGIEGYGLGIATARLDAEGPGWLGAATEPDAGPLGFGHNGSIYGYRSTMVFEPDPDRLAGQIFGAWLGSVRGCGGRGSCSGRREGGCRRSGPAHPQRHHPSQLEQARAPSAAVRRIRSSCTYRPRSRRVRGRHSSVTLRN
jgi:hypothetical protein